MVAEKLYEFAAKEIGAAYATVKIAYTPPQRRSLWEKLRYKLAVRRKGGPVWARIGDTRQMVRRYPGHNSRRAFVQAVLAYGCSSYLAERLLNPRRREEVRFAAPYCPAPGDRLYHWTVLDNMADIRAHGLRPANRSGYVYITDNPDYIANSSYFYWKVGRIGQDATFVLLEIDACALARTQPIMQVLEHHEFAVPAVPPEYLTPV